MKQKISALFFLSIVFIGVGCQKDDVDNVVPVADAGPSKTTTLPADSVQLSGSGTDKDGQIKAYLWSKVSGPASANIVNPGAASTMVKGLTQGSYIFQLMVTDDDGATGVDTVSVQVNPPTIHTITLQPSNNPFEWEVVLNNGVDGSTTSTPDIPVEAWTFNSNPLFIRELIKFDLSSVPANATITNATLSLYSYPNPTHNGNLVDANFGTANSMLIQRVTSPWSSVTWNTQPSTTTTNQIVVPNAPQGVLDLNLDVTQQVAAMVNGNVNYGFFFKLQNEVTYNSRIFVSSYNTTYPDKHPKLVVTFQ
jgi:hypothetical protein